MKEYNIVFVSSKICGGKSTFGKKLAEKSNYKFVEVSDIVKDIMKAENRADIKSTKIAIQITKTISDYIKEDHLSGLSSGMVISGIREIEICLRINDIFYQQHRICTIWIDVADSLRRERFNSRQRVTDSLSFEYSDNIDTELGLEKVREVFCKMVSTITINKSIFVKIGWHTDISSTVALYRTTSAIFNSSEIQVVMN
jgi:cytidylate kinase